MVKKLISFLVVAAFAVAIPTTVFAHHGGGYATTTPRNTTGTHCTTAQAKICNTLIFDADGNYIAEEDYSAVIDQAIKDGTIAKADRDFYIDRYDTCIANHGACVGTNASVSRGYGRGYGRGHCR